MSDDPLHTSESAAMEALQSFLDAEFDCTYSLAPGSGKPFTARLAELGFVVMEKARALPEGWKFMPPRAVHNKYGAVVEMGYTLAEYAVIAEEYEAECIAYEANLASAGGEPDG